MELPSADLERIESWAADFADTPAYASLSPACKQAAVPLAAQFLRAACESEGVGPEEVGEAGFRAAMFERIPALELPDEVRGQAPEILALFVESLREQGRNPGGGPFVRALAPAYRERLKPGGGVRTPPVRLDAPSIGRNDPCPCGSGRKYKKCCGK